MSTSALPKHVATGQAVATNPALGEQRVHSPPAYAGSVESDEVVLLGFSDGEMESAILSREHEAAGLVCVEKNETQISSPPVPSSRDLCTSLPSPAELPHPCFLLNLETEEEENLSKNGLEENEKEKQGEKKNVCVLSNFSSISPCMLCMSSPSPRHSTSPLAPSLFLSSPARPEIEESEKDVENEHNNGAFDAWSSLSRSPNITPCMLCMSSPSPHHSASPLAPSLFLSSHARPEIEESEEDVENERENDVHDAWSVVLPLRSFHFCVWGMGHLSKPTFLSFLEKVLLPQGLSLAQNVKKIGQVSQNDGQVRYDVHITHKHFMKVDTCMRSLGPAYDGYSRVHVPYHLRKHHAPPKVEAQDTIRILSLNINGLKNKSAEFSHLLSYERIDVALIQETLRPVTEVEKKPVWLAGYNVCEVAMAAHGGDARGLAIAIRSGIQARELTWARSSHCVAVEIRGGVTLIVISVYIPPHYTTTTALKALQECTRKIRARRPHAHILVGGDFNASASKRSPMLAEVGISPLPFSGNAITFRRGHTLKSAIDFFAADARLGKMSGKIRVLREWDISDHYPVLARVHVGGLPNCTTKKNIQKMNPKTIVEKRNTLLGDNYWAPLMDLTENIENIDCLEEAVSTLLQTSKEIAEENDCFKRTHNGTRKNARLLSRKTVRALDSRRRLASRLTSQEQITPTEHQVYKQHCQRAKKLVQNDKKKSWSRFVSSAVSNRNANSKYYWRWLRSVSYRQGMTSKGALLPPVTPLQSTEPVYEEEEVVEAWTAYYKMLNTDDSKEVKNEAFWETELASLSQQSSLGVDGPITWTEVCAALQRMHPTKAAGPSGIQACWWQLTVDEEHSLTPQSSMSIILFRCITAMWEMGYVPSSLNTSLLVSLFKKGEKTCMENYRGISLGETLLKIVTSVLADRIQTALNQSGRLRREQAGFRRKEECQGQVVALLEICKRREKEGRCTYLCFLDQKKAFGMVPTFAVFIEEDM